MYLYKYKYRYTTTDVLQCNCMTVSDTFHYRLCLQTNGAIVMTLTMTLTMTPTSFQGGKKPLFVVPAQGVFLTTKVGLGKKRNTMKI